MTLRPPEIIFDGLLQGLGVAGVNNAYTGQWLHTIEGERQCI